MAMAVSLNVLNRGDDGAPLIGGDLLNGATLTWGRDDLVSSVATVPIPSADPSTNFSWAKSLQLYVSSHNSLSMHSPLFGRVSTYSTSGLVVYYTVAHNQSAYTAAYNYPASSSDNNITPPTINGVVSSALPLFSSALPYTNVTIGSDGTYVNPLAEMCLGVDHTCSIRGGSVSVFQLKWAWAEG